MLVPTHGAEAPLPPLTAESLLSTWSFEPGLIASLVVALGLYLCGVLRLRRRGVAWPIRRVTWWLVGLFVVLVATSSALGTYDDTLFWVHSVQHMLLQMLAPVFLVLAAPMTLALRTLPRRPRRVMLAITHSRPARFVAHPAVAFAIFALTQFLLYYTPLYEATLRQDWLHNFSHVHFVAVGFLFYWALLAIDPVPHRPMFPLKFGLVVGMAPMHVLLGIPIMMSDRLFAGDYYRELGRSWGPNLIADQNIGGAILWAFGDVSSIVLIGAFLAAWSRSDEREARRADRALDRIHGDAATIRAPWLPPARPTSPALSSSGEPHLFDPSADSTPSGTASSTAIGQGGDGTTGPHR